MIISIKPWLDNADGAGDDGRLDQGGLALSSDAEMEELLREAVSLAEINCFENHGRMDFFHEPVLAREVLEALRPCEGKQFYDGTLGGGGHAQLLLANGAHVIGSDQDLEAIEYVSGKLAVYGDRFLPLHGNFADLDRLLGEAGIDQVDGILLDLGVSSHQLDEAERGFSFRLDGPLDMRMDRSRAMTAADLVNTASEEELSRIFRDFGEEPKAAPVARAIVRRRETCPFKRTSDLADLVATAVPKKDHKHPATRVFQALRIAVNNELTALEEALSKALGKLGPGGVLAVITFHSLEDRIVKQFMRNHSEKTIDRPEWPEPRPNPLYSIDLPHRKPRLPDADELEANIRSRSAKLRVATKI